MIQNFTSANKTWYWGYGARVVPCTSDAGACGYLEAIYTGHANSMLFAGIFWASLGGLVLVWALGYRAFAPTATAAGVRLDDDDDDNNNNNNNNDDADKDKNDKGTVDKGTGRRSRRLYAALAALARRNLLPPAPWRAIFGHTTRLQVLLVALLSVYLAILTVAGHVWGIWYSPVRTAPAGTINTRTTLGPVADRLGVLAYALTPLSILLAQRESLVSLLTGVPAHSFLFLHRWTGHIMVAQSVLHTLGWVLIEAHFYQPQPAVWQALMSDTWMQWGWAALAVLLLLWLASLGVVSRRLLGYEVWRKSHYVLSAVYMGTAIAHWPLLQCFLVPGLALWGADRVARAVRTAVLHYRPGLAGRGGFATVRARCAGLWRDADHGDAFRLEIDAAAAPWAVGQHFFLCFVDGGLWQSHPFTPLCLPRPRPDGTAAQAYIMRAKRGETRRVAALLAAQMHGDKEAAAATTPVILQGPYGRGVLSQLRPGGNVLCVAGGTGIAFVLPILLRLAQEQRPASNTRIELVWAVRRAQDQEWVEPEMAQLQSWARAAGHAVHVWVTGEPEAADGGGYRGRPDVGAVVRGFVDGVVGGPIAVLASGPPAMTAELRTAVARCNSAASVWKGDGRGAVSLTCDDRLE